MTPHPDSASVFADRRRVHQMVVPVPATGLALVGAEGARSVGKPVYFVVGEDARSSEESDKKERLGLKGSLRSARGARIKLSKPGADPGTAPEKAR